MAIAVVTPPDSTQLTTLAAVKGELGISGSGEDARLTLLIARASDAIERYCGRRFGLQTVDESLPWNERARLVLSVVPIVTVTSVSFDGAALDSDSYELEDVERGFIFLRSAFALAGVAPASHEVWVPGITKDARGEEGRHLWTVRYQGGYDLTGTIPPDLEDAAIETVQALYHRGRRDPNVKSERLGDWSASYGSFGPSGLPESVEKRLLRWTRIL